MTNDTRNLIELGPNLQKIVNRLMANENLMKLLYYTDKDPLSQPNLTDEQKQNEIFNKLLKVIPRVGPKDTANSIVTVRVASGHKISRNTEFMSLVLSIEVFVPLTQWIIKSDNLRPFLILGEIKKSLDNKDINGLGKIIGGDFDLNFLTDEFSCYEQTFQITQYD